MAAGGAQRSAPQSCRSAAPLTDRRGSYPLSRGSLSLELGLAAAALTATAATAVTAVTAVTAIAHAAAVAFTATAFTAATALTAVAATAHSPST